jgi:hypothetical protein
MPSLLCLPRPVRGQYIKKSTADYVILLSAYLMLLIIVFPMQVQCSSSISSVYPIKLAFPMSFHDKVAFPVLVHGNLTKGLIELYHDARNYRNCSIELFQ